MDDHPEPRDLDDALDRLHDDIVDLIRRIIDEDRRKPPVQPRTSTSLVN
jgi:hypothetical protein